MADFDLSTLDDSANNNLLTPQGARDVRAMAPWVKFVAILCYIGTGFSLLGVLYIFAFSALMGNASGFSEASDPRYSEFAGAMGSFVIPFALVYVAIAALYFFLGRWLWRFQASALQASQNHSPEAMSAAMLNIKNVFKTLGIAFIAGVALYIVFLIVFFGIVASMDSGM